MHIHNKAKSHAVVKCPPHPTKLQLALLYCATKSKSLEVNNFLVLITLISEEIPQFDLPQASEKRNKLC